MSDGAQNLSRREMMRLGATGVAAASIANLPVMADEQAASDKLPTRRYGRTGLEIGWLVWKRPTGRRSLFLVRYAPESLTGTRPKGGTPLRFRRSLKLSRESRIISSVS